MLSNILPKTEGHTVHLRPLTPADAESIYAIFSDPQVMRYWSTPPLPDMAAGAAAATQIHKDMAAAESLLTEIINDVAQGRMMKWGIARTEDDFVIGTATLFHIDLDNGR